MKISSIRTPGLGDATYIFAHEGRGIVVDPQRDVGRFLDQITDLGVEVRFVLETHLHNDYVSGGRDLAERTGAELVIPAAGSVAFTHRPAFHLEDLDGGPFTVRPIHTPGHTPEHMSYLVLLDDEPVAVFSGGSLLVGSAGRPDLLGFDRAEQLARLQYISVNRLAELPDRVGLYPTHGQGSFCTSTAAGESTSTIGTEKRTNPVLRYPNADAFVDGQLAGLQPYPKYYAHMGPINLMGPTPLPVPTLPLLTPEAVPADASLVDIRPQRSYAAAHVRGSYGIELSDQTGVWSGWLIPFDSPIVLIAGEGQDVVEANTQLERIGYDQQLGVVAGVEDLAALRDGTASYRLASVDDVVREIDDGTDPQILDVRAPGEWDDGHLPGSIHCYVPDLVDGVPEELDPDRPVWVMCVTGYRAEIAVTYLEAAGFEPIVVVGGGVPEALRVTKTG